MQADTLKPRGKIFYGWYVVAFSFIIMSISTALYFSWPVFYVAILDDFGWSRAETAIIFSFGSTVYGFASPVSGFLFDRFGPRKLFIISAFILFIGAIGVSQSHNVFQLCLFFGIFISIGSIGAGFIPNAAMIANWFVKRRGTAMGITQAATRDAFLVAPVIQLLILAVGWRQSYLVLGGLVIIIIIPLSLLIRARPQDMGLLPDGASAVVKEKAGVKPSTIDKLVINKEWAATDWTLRKAMRGYHFWCLFATMVGTGICYTSLINHFVALVTDVGFDAVFAASLLAVYAVTAIIGRVGSFISDFLGREKAFTAAMVATLLPLPILLQSHVSAWMLYLFIGCYGIGNGLSVPVYSAAASDLFQGKNFGSIIGLANLGYGLSASLGTWLFGYIFDVSGTYFAAIIITMLGVLFMTAAIWIAAPRKVRQTRGKRIAEGA